MRVHKSTLVSLLQEIYMELGLPPRFKQGVDGMNPGAIYLDHNASYGGWDLCEITNPQGGEASLVNNTFGGSGRLKAREMQLFLQGMLLGIRKERKKSDTKGSD